MIAKRHLLKSCIAVAVLGSPAMAQTDAWRRQPITIDAVRDAASAVEGGNAAPGDRPSCVGQNVRIEGRYDPSGTQNIWILVQPSGPEAEYFLQPSPVNLHQDGKWSINIGLGAEDSRDQTFFIEAVANPDLPKGYVIDSKKPLTDDGLIGVFKGVHSQSFPAKRCP